MNDCLSQSRLKRETGSSSAVEQSRWLKANYGLRVRPAADGRLYVEKELWLRARLEKPVEDEFELDLDAAS